MPASDADMNADERIRNTASDTIVVGGLRTVVATRAEFAELMVADCLSARAGIRKAPALAFSSNGESIALAGRDIGFRALMDGADYIHADGMSVVHASALTGTRLPERICTTDFFHDAARAAMTNNLSFYFLGGTEQQNSRAVERVQEMYPALRIPGRHHGYFDESEAPRVLESIRRLQPDVVWVALGRPKQESWCHANRELLQGVGWLKTCGGLYSYLSGEVPRAPGVVRAIGLEWAYRALLEPRRLGWRYLTTNPYAAMKLLRDTERYRRRV